MGAPAPRSGELIQGINVTPMVDVVLVLLVVLMVSTSYTVSQSLPLQLPHATTGETPPKAPFAVSVDESGTLHLDGIRVSREELRKRIRELSRKSEASVLIAADRQARHGSVVGVLDLLRSEGVTKFAINVAPEGL